MSKEELMEQYTTEQMAEKILEYEEEDEKLNADAKKWYQECQQHRKVYQTICCMEDLQSENVRLEKEYAEALKRLEERQEKIKELESKQYDGILFISVDGKPKAYTEETLCEMAKVYEDLKYCKEHEGEHLHSEEHLKILRLHNENSKLRHEINTEQDEINSLSEQNKRNENIINVIDDILEKLFGVRHDVGNPNEFEKILKEKVENYKTISDLIPAEPIKVADMLINASKKRTNCMTGKEYDKYVFEKWQLRQIAEHLLVYCNNQKDDVNE